MTTFEIDNIISNERSLEDLNSFLVSQPSLTDLRVTNTSKEILKTIFSIKSLSKLSLNNCLPRNEKFYKYLNLNEMSTIKELRIEDNLPNENATKFILEKCQNLKKFKLKYSSYKDLIKHLSVHCRKLIRLSINVVESSLDIGMNFAQLKHLRVKRISNNLISLLNCCPSIEKLDVKLIKEAHFRENDFDVLMQNPKWSHLILRFNISKAGDLLYTNHCDVFVANDYKTETGSPKILRLTFATIHELHSDV